MEVGVGDGAGVAGLTLPVEGDLVAVAGFHMAVEAVLGHVERSPDEPPGVRQVPLQDGVPLLAPGQQVGRLSGPEPLVVLGSLVVQLGVADQGVDLERLAGRERPVLQAVDLDGRVVALLRRHGDRG